jgi:hypothetical protein
LIRECIEETNLGPLLQCAIYGYLVGAKYIDGPGAARRSFRIADALGLPQEIIEDQLRILIMLGSVRQCEPKLFSMVHFEAVLPK